MNREEMTAQQTVRAFEDALDRAGALCQCHHRAAAHHGPDLKCHMACECTGLAIAKIGPPGFLTGGEILATMGLV